ncbi:hypothetical protein [Streptomyces phaeochromogenes]|uniref:hypothetical protein n=1 Tax=Streptomyces phaeochromogenes TaxID=1923 RepID=UPI002DD983F2|nr:hypothetical protein [Streptomyces phaeochromogenes]WRZ30237.1 hypothetical protein OG931_22030 [Streptomyces phaeochromogenes]
MELFIEVERHSGAYFEPYITDHITAERAGCVFHFHEDDITDEGADLFCQVLLQQARKWNPLPADAPRGQRIPIWMEMRTDLPDGYAILVEDCAEFIKYIARPGLIEPRAAESITRHQSERSPDWWRLPARYGVRSRTA